MPHPPPPPPVSQLEPVVFGDVEEVEDNALVIDTGMATVKVNIMDMNYQMEYSGILYAYLSKSRC